MIEESIILLSEVNSSEGYIDNETGEVVPVLRDINLSVNEGQVLGISSKEKLESQLMCRIIGNLIPYFCGRCVLNRIGMMQNKRLVLEHLFYIDTHSMLYENMKVLEYLMFATSKISREKPIKRQREIFNDLLEIGLGYISLSQIEHLTLEERVVVELLLASYSESKIIVLDITEYDFSDRLIDSMRQICDRCRSLKKTVVIGTMQAKLIGICCDLTTFIVNGQQRYTGSVEELYMRADPVLYVLFHSNPQRMLDLLMRHMPEYEYEVSGKMLFVMRKDGTLRDDAKFFNSLSKYEIFPDNVKINRGRVQNSFEELLELNDLQE